MHKQRTTYTLLCHYVHRNVWFVTYAYSLHKQRPTYTLNMCHYVHQNVWFVTYAFSFTINSLSIRGLQQTIENQTAVSLHVVCQEFILDELKKKIIFVLPIPYMLYYLEYKCYRYPNAL